MKKLLAYFFKRKANTKHNVESYSLKEINSTVQFDVDNTWPGSSKRILRIGSVVNAPGAAYKYDLECGASDYSDIRDQYGAGCLAIQGFSEITCTSSVIVSEVHIITESEKQRAVSLFHNTIRHDFVVISEKDETKSTNHAHKNLKTYKLNKQLSSVKYFEYVILPDTLVTIILTMSSVENTRTLQRLSDEKSN